MIATLDEAWLVNPNVAGLPELKSLDRTSGRVVKATLKELLVGSLLRTDNVVVKGELLLGTACKTKLALS